MKRKIISVLLALSICLSLCITTKSPVRAADNDVFEVPITNDEGTYTGNVKFKVTSEANKTVQLGTGVAAEANFTFKGGLTIPTTVINNGTTYSVTAISNSAFYESSSAGKTNKEIIKVSGESIKEIGSYAFAWTNISSIDFPEATLVKEYAFWYDKYLTMINLPKVETINEKAFFYSKAITNVSLPKVKTIGNSAFANMTGLTTVDIPEATLIDEYAFDEDYSLKTVNAPKVVTVEFKGFSNSGLEFISLPSATTVKDHAFFDCRYLRGINLMNVTTMTGNPFAGNTQNIQAMVLGIMNNSSPYSFPDLGDYFHYPKKIYLPSGSIATDIKFGTKSYLNDVGGTLQKLEFNITGPESLDKHLGDAANLQVDVGFQDDLPFQDVTFQWEKKVAGAWQTLPNENLNILLFDSISISDAGNYRCKVSSVTYPSLVKTSSEAIIKIVPYQSDFKDTTVGGIIEGAAYVRGSVIEFTANGAGMSRQSPFEGDTRYEPISWKVNNESGVLSSPYTGTFDTTNFPYGETKLEITFVEQQYTSGVWQDTRTRVSHIKTLIFNVEKLTNNWIKEPSISGWTYGENAHTPDAQANVGTVVYSYSNQENGTFTSPAPTEAGIWYMKASVTGVNDFKDLEKIISFTINPKDITTLTISDITKEVDILNLVIYDGNKLLVLNKDYTVHSTINDQKGLVEIIGIGNYTGSIAKEITIEKKSPITGVGSNTDLLCWAILLSGCTLFYEYRRKKVLKK